jgi:hypothetical protein
MRTGIVQPHSSIEAASWTTCSSLCVRAFRALGTSLASGQRSTRSAGHALVISHPKANQEQSNKEARHAERRETKPGPGVDQAKTKKQRRQSKPAHVLNRSA